MMTSHLRSRAVGAIKSPSSKQAQQSQPARTPLFPKHYNNTTTLSDGRILSWSEAGNIAARPLFFFHGSPGSRLEARGLEDIGKRLNVRFICPERPGYGRSSFQPDRKITDWPDDVRQLAMHLGVKRFAVCGGSGGGPYALACAHALPREMISSVGLVCSAAPWEAGTENLPWVSRVGAWLAEYCPGLTKWMFDRLLGFARWYAGTSSGEKMLDALAVKAVQTAGKELTEEDNTPEASVARRNRLLSVLLEPLAQGSREWIHEAYLLSHPYGFELEGVEQKIQLWHGTKDWNSPVGMVRWMAERLPDAELHESDGETHFTMVKELESIVEKLMEDE